MALGSVFDGVFGPLLNIQPLWVIILISFLISLIITIVYKLMTDQKLMKELKDEMKDFQKQMKELRDDPKKMMGVQKKAMERNMKYMSHSMKPTLVTFIPIILIFGWLNAHIAYEPIMPDTEFSAGITLKSGLETVTLIVPDGIMLLSDTTQEVEDKKATWKLKGDAGEYLLEYKVGEKSFTKELLITQERSYEAPIKTVKDSDVKTLEIKNNTVKPLGDLSIFGWMPGWLGTYIIFSLVFSMSMRKLLKLH